MQLINIEDKHFEAYISKEEIKETVQRLSKSINKDYAGRDPVLLVVLRGAFVFASDLIRRLSIDFYVDFIQYNSYKGTETSPVVEVIGTGECLKGKDVIIIEDIIDTGKTLDVILKDVKKKNPKSIGVVSLLVKPHCLLHQDESIYYKGKYIKEHFVVGYGMDYNGKGRNIQSIYREVLINQ